METYWWLALPENGCWVTAQGCVCRLCGDLNNGLAAQFQWPKCALEVSCTWDALYKSTSLPFLGRPCTVVTGGLIKCSWCFSFFSTPNLRAPSANHRETLPHDRCLCLFYKLTTKIRGSLPPNKLGAKNMQNFGRFYTTSDFDREYLRNGSTYPKSDD